METWLLATLRSIGIVPTPEQADILAWRGRFTLVAGGEQAGKSVVASLHLLRRHFELAPSASARPFGPPAAGAPAASADDAPPALYWLVGASYGETRREFEYLAEWFAALRQLRHATPRVNPGRLLLVDGSRVETKSGVNPHTLSKDAPDGVIACEASQLRLETFERLRGRVTPRNGWLFLAGTFEQRSGWYPQLWNAWRGGAQHDRRSFSLPSWSNRALYPGGIDDPRLEALRRDSTDDFFMERIAGRPAPPRGLVVPEFRPDIHVRDIPFDPALPLELAIDPGYAGAYAVEAIQSIGGQDVIVDEIYERGLITHDIIDIAKRRPWWPNVQGGVIDIAGFQHQAMPAPAEVWLNNAALALGSVRVPINAGAERIRAALKTTPERPHPRLLIAPRCRGILSELGAEPNPFDGQTRPYAWKTDREGNIIGAVPQDRNNHGIKAVIYYLVDKYGYATTPRPRVFNVARFP